jgi:hypothetical protein
MQKASDVAASPANLPNVKKVPNGRVQGLDLGEMAL